MMANTRLSMRKIKEFLRLIHHGGLSDRQVALSLAISRSTVVETGLEIVLRSDVEVPERERALERLQKGLRLGGKPLTRAQAHERE